MKLLVTYARPYAITDEKTKTENKGLKIEAIDLENVANDKEERGCPVLVMSAPYEAFSQFPTLPGFYDLSVAMARAKNSRGSTIPTFKVTAAKFLADMNGVAAK